jgi:hypothetical protein
LPPGLALGLALGIELFFLPDLSFYLGHAGRLAT